MAYPIKRLRELFNVAADVKDSDLNRAFYEADQLDTRPQICVTYDACPESYKADTPEFTGLDTIICYYAFARYLQTSEQQSTASGVKIQNYLGSYIVPDIDRAKRFEAERGKADLFIVSLIEAMRKGGLIENCECKRVQARICLIK